MGINSVGLLFEECLGISFKIICGSYGNLTGVVTVIDNDFWSMYYEALLGMLSISLSVTCLSIFDVLLLALLCFVCLICLCFVSFVVLC